MEVQHVQRTQIEKEMSRVKELHVEDGDGISGPTLRGKPKSKAEAQTEAKAETLKKRASNPRPVPCRLRTYDPDKHCGVEKTPRSGPCKRAINCKQHNVTSRRQVVGRSKDFNVLLAEAKSVCKHS
jgi:hypothetical protein